MIVYIVEELPSKEECKKFCSAEQTENRNLITIANGVISSVYIGIGSYLLDVRYGLLLL